MAAKGMKNRDKPPAERDRRWWKRWGRKRVERIRRGEIHAVTAKDPQLGRLAYDARKWQASKLAPKVYGEKGDVSVGPTLLIRRP